MTGSSSEEIAENVAEIVVDELGKTSDEYGNGPKKGIFWTLFFLFVF